MAAGSSSTLTLQWTGTIPTASVTAGSWKFVSSTSSSVDFVPTNGTITVTNGSVAGTKNLVLAPVNFSIAASSGRKFTNSSSIKAYLASATTFTGLNPASDATSSDAPSMTIKVNDKDLSVGSAQSVDVSTFANATTELVNISIKGSGTLPQKSYTSGDSFTASSTIVFTADVT
ncbi:hypothetical protein S479_22415 [Salmonella enterica subsp. enterica serovar Newport]|nr:hypothetical protein [Salmonella enterica subsp. enterica serovar Newport]